MSRNLPVAAILMLLTGVEAQHRAILSSQSLCAVTGSTVKISCTFRPDHSSVTQREWYRVQNPEAEPRVLSKDPQYSERVSVNTVGSDCDLTVRNVSVSDSGVYNFRFKTHTSDWISTSGVHLTVTGLQLKVDYDYVRQGEVKVTCSSICSLGTHLYSWYRENKKIKSTNENFIVLDSTRPSNFGNYFCEEHGSLQRSPPVCVLDKKCWGVTNTPERVCALKGTSVDIPCFYKHPEGSKLIKSAWLIKRQADGGAVDVREDEEYQGRVQYTQNSPNNCSLRITNLRERDAQTYRFRFITDGGDYTGQPGVSLSVTGLQVTVSSTTTDGGTVTLSCISTCTPSNNPTYIWYRNGQRVSDCKSASCSVAAVAGAVSYSCAVEGHDSFLSPPVYSPKNTRAVVVPSGDTVEGDSVTLSCSSDANPPVVTYSWFQQRAAADTLLIPEQNYSISNISSQHSGLYYCTAHNRLGHNNSTLIHLDVFYPPRNRSVTLISSVSGDSITLSCESQSNPSSSYTWYWRSEGDVRLGGNGSNVTFSSRENGFYFCSARNRFGSSNSSEWENAAATESSGMTAAVSGVTFVLLLILIAVFLWMRYPNWKKALVNRSEENSNNNSALVYGNVSVMTCDPTQAAFIEDQDDVQYTSIYFRHAHKQETPLYSTVQLPKALKQEEEVEYATVNSVQSRAALEGE